MKPVSLLLILLVVAGYAIAQPEKPVDSKITRVTVFLNRAQVTRELKTRVEAGKTSLVLSGLTAQLDQQSVQVSGKGNFILLGINHRQNFISEFNLPKSLRVLNDSLDYYKRLLLIEQQQKDVLSKEEQLLLANQKIGGNNQNITVNELKAMAEFYRSRLGEIGMAKIKSDEKIRKTNERISKLNQQIQEQNELYSRNTSEIVISLAAETAGTVDLEVNYVVANAGWYAVYDLRAVNTKSPIQLSYKANVFQSTGEDWKDVRLKLSTANPSLGGTKPELYTWYLDFYYPTYKQREISRMGAVHRAAPEKAEEVELSIEVPPTEQKSVADYTQTIQTSLNTEFDISLPYTVVSASKPTLVDIRNHEMKADYRYAVAPKLDNDAFLMARATGWEDFSLLPGEANVFFEGTFVGNSFIDPNNVKDTISVSLGRDKRIVVQRERVKDFTSRKAIGSSIRETAAWEITVRNTRNEPVKLVMEDQVPISKISQIEVTVVDVGGAKYTKDTGKLVWEMNLQPNESKKVVFKYEVKYPKDRQVSGL
ncbi:MAG: DUF4139 domain-containing protein [Flammeovirgaceae bacterium]|nr:MAG: DUF4139 domain-containing protein [Flammeovirgaceae bacterium]